VRLSNAAIYALGPSKIIGVYNQISDGCVCHCCPALPALKARCSFGITLKQFH
jgi:hypothetical protein